MLPSHRVRASLLGLLNGIKMEYNAFSQLEPTLLYVRGASIEGMHVDNYRHKVFLQRRLLV